MNVMKTVVVSLFVVCLLSAGVLAVDAPPVKERVAAPVAPPPPVVAPTPPPAPLKPMADHLLPANAEWRQYYALGPQDQVQLYFNITVLLDAARQQAAQIAALQMRIKDLEAKLADQPAVEKKAPEQPQP